MNIAYITKAMKIAKKNCELSSQEFDKLLKNMHIGYNIKLYAKKFWRRFHK
jgi:hypothetical protein